MDEDDFKEIAPLIRRMTQQQEQLRKDRDEIARSAQIRQDFTANVSHELKTPLHAISGYAELLENGMVQEKDIRPFAAKIRSESLRMAKLVEDTIGLSKLDSGAPEMKWEDTDLFTMPRMRWTAWKFQRKRRACPFPSRENPVRCTGFRKPCTASSTTSAKTALNTTTPAATCTCTWNRRNRKSF